MDHSPSCGAKQLRTSNSVRKSRAANPNYGRYLKSAAAADAAEASVIDTANDELFPPHPLPATPEHPPPPENVPSSDTKQLRRSNRIRKLRATNPNYGRYLKSAANDELFRPRPLPRTPEHSPPPENVAQQSLWFDDPSNPDINWGSPLGQYVLRALSYAAMAGEPVPSAVDLYRSIEARGEESTKKKEESIDDKSTDKPLELPSVTAPSPPVIDGPTALPVSIDRAHEAQCEVCKISFDTMSVLDEHLLGKRHKNKLLKLESGDAITEPQEANALATLDKSIVASEGNHKNREVDDVSESNHSLLAGSTPLPSASIDDMPINGPLELPIVTANPPPPVFSGCTPFPGSTDKPVIAAHEIWCEVCKICCSSKFHLGEHVLGRRHKKNLQKLKSEGIDRVIAEPQGPRAFTTLDNSIIASEGNPENQEVDSSLLASSTTLPSASIDDTSNNNPLEFPVVAAPSSLVIDGCSTAFPVSIDKGHEPRCQVSKIDCSTKSVLGEHQLGKRKRRKKNLPKSNPEGIDPVITERQGSPTLDKTNFAPEGHPHPGNQEIINICPKSLKNAVDDGTSKPLPSGAVDDRPTNEPLELPVVTALPPGPTDKNPVSGPHETWCEVCKIECSKKCILDEHLLGRRHKKNLLKPKSESNDPAITEPQGPPNITASSSEPTIAAASTCASSDGSINPESLKRAADDVSTEDPESKRRKVLACGA